MSTNLNQDFHQITYLMDERKKSLATASVDKQKFKVKNSYDNPTSQKMNFYSQNSVDIDEKVQKVSPPRRKGTKDEKSERTNWLERGASGSDLTILNSNQQGTPNYITIGPRQYEAELAPDGKIDAILEQKEALIVVHRKEIDDTTEIVHEEMKLLTEMDQPC